MRHASGGAFLRPLVGTETIRPCQWFRRPPAGPVGVITFAAAVLESACREAGLLTSPARRRPIPPAQLTIARAWLRGELDDQVAVSVRWCCDALALDAAAFAAAVRRRCG